MTDRLQAAREALPLKDCPIGLFLYKGALCLKTEYGNNEGRLDAYIVSSGEFFWGDPPQTISSQRAQMVVPIKDDDLREALALLQSGPDTSRQSSETGQADSLRIFGDGVRSLAARLPLEEGWLKGLALAVEHAARALDAAAEGQGWKDMAVSAINKLWSRSFNQDDDGTESEYRRGLNVAIAAVGDIEKPAPPVSASKPEGA